jgi:arylsulfatase A-like enzyme
MKSNFNTLILALPALAMTSCTQQVSERMKDERPNIIIIYTDDVGYGDLSCYGATMVKTPEIDRLASKGLRFTSAYATSSTCTPSRYGLLTGEYPWRKEGTGIARGDASLIIKPGTPTIASVLKEAGYTTGVVGKWHLGLGPEGGPDWNGHISPGPQELGFNYSFLIPATGDRVPCVYVENGRVVGLDPSDPIKVSFSGPLDDQPTGKDNPELLKMLPSHGHNMSIVNGISRIGYMTGGHAARWRDEDMADVITERAVNYIKENKDKPFFLYFATHDIHVPRVPHERFAGQNEMGPRGDVILQLDWCVGEIMKELEKLSLTNHTLVIFSSDNGPVVDDGYHDQSVEKLGNHKPAGGLRGAKYSAYEGGTSIPFIAQWPGKIKPGTSPALFSQVDLLKSIGALVKQELPENVSSDGINHLPALLGTETTGRSFIIQQNAQSTLSVIKGNWKYIEPSSAREINIVTTPHIELGNNPLPQLYKIVDDPGEKVNLAFERPEVVEDLAKFLEGIKAGK